MALNSPSQVHALIADDQVNSQISEWVKRPVQLAFMDAEATRYSSPRWAGESAEVSFADGYPILIACTASLEELNRVLMSKSQSADAVISMNRFRPNIVVETSEPWIEDNWSKVRIGAATFDLVKPCDRCVVTTQDQYTGIATENEPIATLMFMRRSAHQEIPGVLFGINSVPTGGNAILVGDNVDVIQTDSGRWPLH